MPERSPSDYRDLRAHLREKDTVGDMSLERRMSGAPSSAFDDGTDDDLYLRFICGRAGIDMWSLHERFDVDVVYAWHDPTVDKLRMGLRLRVDDD